MKISFLNSADNWWVVVGLVVVDQISKIWARAVDITVLNTGGVLGILDGKWWVGITLAALMGLGWYLAVHKVDSQDRWGWRLIVAGGVGNLIDRLVFGGVWDFIRYPIIEVTGNVADVFLTIGVGWLMFIHFRKEYEK